MRRTLRMALAGLPLLLAGSALASEPSDPDDGEAIPPKPETFPGSYIHQLIYGPEDPGKPQLLMYPVIAYAPETRLEVGLSTLVLFHSKGDVNNRLSEIPLYAFYTMNNQFGLVFEHAIFSDGAYRSYLGEGMIADFPLKYYGIGIDAEYDDSVVVYARQLIVRERLLFRVNGSSDVFFGPEVGFASFGDVRFEADDGRPVDLPVGGDGTTNLTLGLGVAHDTRHNPLNVRDGVFAEIAWLGSSSAFISEYSFANLYADLRGYQPLGPEHDVLLAWQALGQFGRGDLPFNELGLIGGEGMMRGYYRGRYRDRNMVATQLELRFLPLPLGFTERIGLAGFVATGTVFSSFSELPDARPLLTGGGGLRVLTFPSSDIYTRLDVGVSEDGTGVYLYVGEAF